METINQVIKVLFQEVRSEDVISYILKGSDSFHNFDSLVDSDIFARQLIHVNAAKTLNHAEIIYNVLRDEWSMPNDQDYHLLYCKYPDLFNVLLHFSYNKLYIEKDTPVCRYEELLSWHEITREFGEDLFVTSYRAAYDLRRNYKLGRFDWNSYLSNDAKELKELFDKDMYDLHAHLYGSSLNFELNWMSLMNVLGGHEIQFAKLDSSKVYPSVDYRLNTNGRPMYVKILCAAIIRLYLFLDTVSEAWSNDIMIKLRINDVLSCDNLIEMLSYAKVAQEYIDSLGYSMARIYVNPSCQTKYIPDYAILGNDQSVFSVLGGERRLMYNIFQKIYSGEYFCEKKSALFYLYILIKDELRREMVQVNHSLGFENFSDYQSRKSMFIQEGSVYEHLLAQMAVGTFMNDSKSKRYVEMRIAPRKTTTEDIRQIQQNDKYIVNDTFAPKLIISKDNYNSLSYTSDKNAIVTIGIKPSRPETGYGYIASAEPTSVDEIYKVEAFKEKPNLETAEQYLAAGNYYWNAGIFVWNIDTISKAIRTFQPQLASIMDEMAPSFYTEQEKEVVGKLFPTCEKISIDYAVMEKSKEIYTLPAEFGWSDLGSWGSLRTLLPQDEAGNAKVGKDIRLYECKNCVVHAADESKVVVQGLDGYIVAEKNGQLLVCSLKEEQRIKEFGK